MTATLKQSKKLLEIFEDISNERLQKLISSGLLTDLRDSDPSKIVRSEFRKACGLLPESKPVSTTIKYDKTKDGWTGPLEDVGPRITSVKGLELLPFLKRGESYVNGEVMKKRAEEQNANFGQLDAEWLLEHQSEIPKEFRKYYLAFPGTVRRDSDGSRCVAFLYWSDDQWCLRWDWLGSDWSSGDRLLCLSK